MDFDSHADAMDWRSAQIWDGGIGMTPLPERIEDECHDGIHIGSIKNGKCNVCGETINKKS